MSLHASVLAGVLCVCLLLVGLDAWRTYRGWEVAIAQDNAETANLARALARQASDTVQAADAAVVGVRERAEDEGQEPGRAGSLTGFVQRMAQNLPLLGGLSVLDVAGFQIASSGLETPGIGYADRSYFKFHSTHPDRGTFVGPPIRRKADGARVFTLSRRIDTAQGGFGGVAEANIPLASLRSMYEAISIGEKGVIALISDDGIEVVRRAGSGTVSGDDVSASPALREFLARSPAGSVPYLSEIDGVRRIGSYRRIDGYPLTILVAHGAAEVLAPWRAQAWLDLLVTGGAVTTVAGLGMLAARQIRRGERVERRYRLLADNSSDAIVCMSADGRRTYISPAFYKLTGWSEKDIADLRWGSLTHPDDQASVLAIGPRLLAGEDLVTCTFRYLRKDGTSLWVESCTVLVEGGDRNTRFIGSIRDITTRKAAEDRLAALNSQLAAHAITDSLTGLANRRRFDEVAEQEWRRAVREATPLSLLMIDVDRFKLFNDCYGHPAGDDCLRVVAKAVADVARRPGDLVARYGGEEMVVLLPCTGPAGAAELAERVRTAIEACGIAHADNTPAGLVTASVGYATMAMSVGEDAEGVSSLVAAADAALYEAKHGGRNRAVAWTAMPCSPAPPTPPDEERRLAMPAQLRIGERDEFLDRLAASAASLLDVPVALVTIVGRDHQ